MSNRLDPDQDQQNVGPDLGPTLFAKVTISEEMTKVANSRETVNSLPTSHLLINLANRLCLI